MKYLNTKDTNKNEICRKCGSEEIRYSKQIGWGIKMGQVYHYTLHCNNCGTNYKVKRTREIFEILKNEPWGKSKAVRQMEIKQTLF